jgi:hypothetical protein
MATISSFSQLLLEVQIGRFRNQTERTFLIIRASLADRQAMEELRINAKYDGKKANRVEAEIQHLSDLKTAAAEKQIGLRAALNKLGDLREQLSIMRDAASAGNAVTFDLAQAKIDELVGYSASDLNNPIGHVTAGSSGARSLSVDLGSMGAVYYNTQSLSARYSLAIAGSSVGDPDLQKQTIKIDGAEIAFTSLNFISRVGYDVTFDDGTTTYTAAYSPGGLGVASAFIYNNLATAPEQTQAIADIDAAMTAVAKVEQSLVVAEAAVIGGVKSFEFKLSQLGKTYKAAYDDQNSAQEAELKAAQARFDLSIARIGLLGKTQLAQAELLMKPTPVWETSVKDILQTRLFVQSQSPISQITPPSLKPPSS